MSKRPGILGANERRPGAGVAANSVESNDEEITSYLKRSAKAFDDAVGLFVDSDSYTS